VTLQDLENAVLIALAMPYANPGGTITYPGGADFGQAKVDWAINRGLTRLVTDLGDIELLTQQLVFPGATGVYSYLLQTQTGQPATAIGTYASGTVTFSGTVAAGQTPTVTIGGTAYSYTVPSASTTITQIISAITQKINAGTQILPNSTVLSPVNQALNGALQIPLMAGAAGTAGNATTLTATSSGTLTLTASGTTLLGGTAANQPIRMVRRVFYQALGQIFRLELEPGARLISWQEFNRKTSAGYLLPFSFTTWPDYCAVSPRRGHLYFYGAPSVVGDTITVEYCPIVTANTAIPASQWGYLVNATDIPLLPEDTQDAIWMQAVAFLQPNAREYATGKLYSEMYKEELQRAKDNYGRDSAGDALILRPVGDALATSGYDSFANIGG
jgi:hypothetical protein